MIITLIGMSGTGKSHWSQKLVDYGFKRFCCDDIIESKLVHILKEKGFQGIHDVAKWMGQPYDAQYPDTSDEYLRIEIEVMQDLLRRLQHISVRENIVLDTTGSVIYVPDTIITQLRKCTTLIYLETPESVRKHMFERYIQDPKPVIWGSLFTKKAGESNIDALSRCYPTLLSYRTTRYETIADIVIKHNLHTSDQFTPDNLIEHIHNYQQNNTCFY